MFFKYKEKSLWRRMSGLSYIKRRGTPIFLAGMSGAFLLAGCQGSTSRGQNRAFESFTREMFCQEVSSSTISLHYTLKNPEEYGIEKIPLTFGDFSTDSQLLLVSAENLEKAMDSFSFGKLSLENQLTYDVLDYYLETVKENAEYLLYEEPLDLVGGVQTQLPVVLSEYQFYDKDDIDTYLSLMKTTPEYFDSLIAFEQEKADAGLFMSDDAAEQVISQCTAFMNMGENNYLLSAFVDRVAQMAELGEQERDKYIQKNALMLNNYVLPAYSRLVAALQNMKGSGKNEQGLCYLPDGKEYYEYVVKTSTGSNESVEELRDLTMRQIVEDLEAMEQVLGITVPDGGGTKETETDSHLAERSEQVQETAAIQVGAQIPQNPVSVLQELQTKITESFPELPDITYSVKYVPDAMQEHLSPAFYMIPAIDAFDENVIYINRAQMGNALTLYTTLAHEGYPGHLYQTVYYASTDPDPIRSILNFGGYVEGWATYAEMCSYYLAPLTKEQSTLLQKNNSFILGLYTLADIGIHYDGWSRTDAFSFFSNYGIKDMDTVDRIYDLIIGCPGNYLKYYIGYVEFLELKKDYVQDRGGKFSQKEFHEAVLSIGPAPFEIVRKYMDVY